MRKLTVEEFNNLFKPEYQLVVKKVSCGGQTPTDYLVLEHSIGTIVSDELRIDYSTIDDKKLVPDIILRKMFNK